MSVIQDTNLDPDPRPLRPKEPPKVEDLFLKSDLHGLPEWYEARSRWEKIIWTLVLIVCTTALVIELYVSFKEFKENPIITTYNVETAELDGVKFPTILICPLQSVHELEKWRRNINATWEEEFRPKDALASFDRGNNSILGAGRRIWDTNEAEVARYVSSEYASAPVVPPPCLAEKIYQEDDYTPQDIVDYYMKVGYPKDVFMKECSFNGKYISCNVTKEVMDRNYGKCFLVDLKGASQLVNGQGLSLVLNLDKAYAYADKPPQYDGVLIRIDEQYDPGSSKRLLLRPGTYNYVQLVANKYSLLRYTSFFNRAPRCTEEDDGAKQLMVLKGTYTLGLCRMDCILRKLIKNCGCILPIDTSIISAKVMKKHGVNLFCSTTQIEECVQPLVRTLHQETDFRKCYINCLVPCNHWEYLTQISTAGYPAYDDSYYSYSKRKFDIVENSYNNYVYNQYNNPTANQTDQYYNPTTNQTDQYYNQTTNQTDQYFNPTTNQTDQYEEPEEPYVCVTENDRNVKKQFVIVDIALSELQYTNIEQEPSMTFTSFVSDIGGQVGLWLGASIVTIIKLFIISGPLAWMGIRKIKKPHPHMSHKQAYPMNTVNNHGVMR